MNHIIGSAVKISCEIPSAQVSGTVLTLDSLIGPDGTERAAGESLAFGTGTDDTNIGSYTWQSTTGTHPTGKYTFIIKAVNGAVENFAKGFFSLEARS